MHWQEALDEYLIPAMAFDRIGLVSDVDGTLSHLVDDPGKAAITPRNKASLARLIPQLTLVAFISGRRVDDVVSKVGLDGAAYVGNHGLEHWQAGQVIINAQAQPYYPVLQAAYEEIRPLLLPGMTIEDKKATLSIHYRRAQDLEQAVALFPRFSEIAGRYGLLSSQGSKIFEVKPPIQVNKGTALDELVVSYSLQSVLYIGDDTTDIDAVVAARALRDEKRCFGIGGAVESDYVPARLRESADFYLSGVTDVEALLDWLSSAAKASST